MRFLSVIGAAVVVSPLGSYAQFHFGMGKAVADKSAEVIGKSAEKTTSKALTRTGTWELTGSMSIARDQHAATVLSNGKVLVAGGFNGLISEGGVFGVRISTAEIYDLTTGIWTQTSSMSIGRNLFTLTLLPDGRVLAVGGGSASAEIFNPGTGTWTPTGSMSNARTSHTATLLPNGTVLVAGGSGSGSSFLSSAEIYNPASGTWAPTGSMNTARYVHTATLLSNGTVLVVGGFNNQGGSHNNLASAEIFSPGSGTWALTGSMSTARYAHTATLLPNGTVLIAGGNNGSSFFSTAEIYSPGSGTWAPTGSMSTTRQQHSATLLPNGTVLIAGGTSAGGISASAEIYNPGTGIWRTTGSMSIAREQYVATILPAGKVLVAGGLGYTDTAELYSP